MLVQELIGYLCMYPINTKVHVLVNGQPVDFSLEEGPEIRILIETPVKKPGRKPKIST